MKYLHELTPQSRFYSVKVTVATKNRAIQPLGKTWYQQLALKDEKAICKGAMNEKQIVTYHSSLERVPNFQLLYNIYMASAK